MKAIGYVRVSTEKQADFGVSLEAQTEKVRAMAIVQGAELAEVIIDAGESAKSLNRPGMARLLSLVDSGAVDTVIIAKLDRLTRSVKDLAELLERFTRARRVAGERGRFPGYAVRVRSPRAEYHGERLSVGAGSDRRADSGRHESQAHKR